MDHGIGKVPVDRDAGAVTVLEALQRYAARLSGKHGKRTFRRFSAADTRILTEHLPTQAFSAECTPLRYGTRCTDTFLVRRSTTSSKGSIWWEPSSSPATPAARLG